MQPISQWSKATSALNSMLWSGALVSRFGAFLDEQKNDGDSAYNRVKAERGAEAARDWWDKRIVRTRMSDHAAAIVPVAKGLMALAQSDNEGKYAHVLEPDSDSTYPRCRNIAIPTPGVVVFNPPDPYLRWPKPAGFDEWRRDGVLGLKAVTLEGGYTIDGKAVALLGLVLPVPRLSRSIDIADGYSVVTINHHGVTDVKIRTVGFRDDAYLISSLGLSSLNDVSWTHGMDGHDLEDVIPRSNAADYLADALPKLGPYLTEMARCLAWPSFAEACAG